MKRPAAAAVPSRALVIKEFWCNKILHSTKTWELRGRATAMRGRICLAQSKTQNLVGEATLTGCLRVGRLENGKLVPWSQSATDKKNFLGKAEKHRQALCGRARAYHI